MNRFIIFLLLLIGCSISSCQAAVSPWSDLIITEISAPVTGSAGHPYAVNVSVENQGNVTSGLVSVGFYLSDDDQLTREDTFIQVATGDPISWGTGTRLPSIETLPPGIAPGRYHLFAFVEDHGGDEQNIQNNIAMLPALVTIRAGKLPDPAAFASRTAELIYEMSNHEREGQGLSPLAWDEDLALLARTYSDRMVADDFFSHTDPDGNDQSDRARAAGYPAVKDIDGGQRLGVSENIAYIGTGNVAGYGYVDPTDPGSVATALMDGWMKSPGHRSNILDHLADRTGTALAWDGEYWYATQEFF